MAKVIIYDRECEQGYLLHGFAKYTHDAQWEEIAQSIGVKFLYSEDCGR